MTFLNKLDLLLSARGINKNVLAKNSGIPYTTIDGWYKKGYEGLKLSTLKKLSEYLGVDLNYWSDVPKESEKPPESEIPNSEDFENFVCKVQNILVDLGYVGEGEDVTDLVVLDRINSLAKIIRAMFED